MHAVLTRVCEGYLQVQILSSRFNYLVILTTYGITIPARTRYGKFYDFLLEQRLPGSSFDLGVFLH